MMDLGVFGDPELDGLLAKAKAAYDAMSYEEKYAHTREQFISFAYGQVNLASREDGERITKEQVGAIFDRLMAEGRLKLRISHRVETPEESTT
jgi:hypothetical protein